MKNKTKYSLIIGLILICFCMRSPLSTVGPLIPQIKETLSLSPTLSGLLTTIPLLLFALVAPIAGKIIHHLTVKRWFLLCAFGIGAGILIRSYIGFWGLIIGTIIIGLSIGILNILIPVWIRQDFPNRIGSVMGVYTTSMTAMSALAAGICVYLSLWLSGWENAMAIFAIFPIIAFFYWIFVKTKKSPINKEETTVTLKEVMKKPSNWSVALFMALQSIFFYILLAWLPSMLVEQGYSEEIGGIMLLILQVVSLITNFLMPIWFQKYPTQRKKLALSCAVVYGSGLILLLLPIVSTPIITIGVTLLGLGSGLSLSFSLTVIAVKGKTGGETIRLSSFAQGLGYLIAAPAPTIFGGLYDMVGNFTIPLILVVLLCIPLALTGIHSVKKIEV